MKRNFFVMGLAIASTLTSFAFATSAKAAPFPEKEPNNDSNPMLIYLSNTTNTTSLNGSVRSSVDSDTFRFEVKKHSDIRATLTNLSGDADLEVLIDNGDGRLAGGDSVRRSIREGKANEEIFIPDAKPGWYFVRVVDSQAFATNVNYTLNIKPTPKPYVR